MKFLGETTEDRIPEIADAIKTNASRYNQFDISLEGINAFPNIKNPRIVWIGVKEVLNKNILSGIFKSLEEGLFKLGFQPENRGFSAHITLARVKSAKNKYDLTKLLEEKSNFSAGTQKITEIRLYQSELNPTDSTYTVWDKGILMD